jgi:hypothetical protein
MISFCGFRRGPRRRGLAQQSSQPLELRLGGQSTLLFLFCSLPFLFRSLPFLFRSISFLFRSLFFLFGPLLLGLQTPLQVGRQLQ